jgi:outer membrane autotransporter protein
MAVSTDRAYGLYANTGDIRILGNITSAAAISATGEYKAQAIRSNGGIFIGTDMAGTLTATSDEGDAAGLYSDGDIAIGGKLSGTITVTADDDAFGIHAGGTLSNGSGGALEITGTISATGTSSSDGVKGVCAHGAMNLKVSGSISAFNDDGAAFAIKGLNNAVDTVELTTGAAITGIIDLGDEIHPVAPPTGPVPLPGGDRLILTGHNSLGGEIRDVEILDVNADADGWKLTYNCNTFGAINLNTGVFGICSGNSTNHVHTGAFNQFAGSTLAVQYDAGGDADIIWVENNGSASVDGTVRIVPVGPMTTETQVYTFISTNYSINGEYSALEKPAIVAAELQKSADGTDYQFTAARRTFSSFDDGIGEAMDKLYEDDYDSELMNLFLGMGTDGQVTDAMRQLEAATAPTSVALSGSQAFSTEITARLSAMRQGIAMARKNPNLGNLPSLAATGDAVIGEALRAAQVARTENHEWQITGRYLGNYGSLDSDTNANGGDWKGNGFMIDIDRQVTENLILGIGAGGSWTSVDIDNNGGEADVESFSARLYASWFDGPWHVDAQVGYGRNRNESTRNIDLFGLMQADGEWDADVYTASLGGGYDIELGKGWVLEPNAALDYTRIDNDGYTETGAGPFNLAVDSSEYDSLRSTIGLALRKDFNFDNGMILRPELRMGWRHEFLDTQVETGATFMGASFTSYGVKQNRESAVIGLGLNLQFNQALGGFISYDADLNTDQTVQAVSIGIRFNF